MTKERGTGNQEQGFEPSSELSQANQWRVLVHEELQENGGGFWAEIDGLPGCYASGDSLGELRIDAAEAIQSHVAALQQVGKWDHATDGITDIPASSLFLVPCSLAPRGGA